MNTKSLSTIHSRGIAKELLLQIGLTIRTLAGTKQSARTVHKTRSTLNRVRASLRLLRESIGDRTYHRCNVLMRDARRQLNAARDAEVLIDTLGTLRRADDGVEMKRTIKDLITALTREHNALKPRPRMMKESALAMRTVLDKINRHSKTLEVVPAEGLVGAYKNSRKAFRHAQKNTTDTNLHEWRKQMKYLACETEALGFNGRRGISRLHRHASHIATYLGDDRDLVMLAMRIAEIHGRSRHLGTADPLRELLVRMKRSRAQLQHDAFQLGRRFLNLRLRRIRTLAGRS